MEDRKVTRFIINGESFSIPMVSETEKGLMSPDEHNKLLGIEKAAQENKIENIAINDLDISLDKKTAAINIEEGSADGTISVQGADIPVHGLKSLAYKSSIAKSDLTYDLAELLDSKSSVTDLSVLNDKINVLNGVGAGSIKKAIDDAFNDFSTNISNDGLVNSYKELIDWVAIHGGEAAEMAASIANIEANYVTLYTEQSIESFKVFTGVKNIGCSNFGVGLQIKNPSGHTSIEVVGGKYTMGLGCHSNGSWYWWRGTDTPDEKTTKSYVMNYDGTLWNFSDSIQAKSFVKKDGLGTQILMADGSVKNLYSSSEISTCTSNDGAITPGGVKKYTDGKFLPQTGGTIKNGTVYNPLIIDTTSTQEVGIPFKMAGVNKGWTGYHPTHGANIYNYACKKYMGLKDDGTPHVGGNKIWNEGNDGEGSGLDADTLDGAHLSDLQGGFEVNTPNFVSTVIGESSLVIPTYQLVDGVLDFLDNAGYKGDYAVLFFSLDPSSQPQCWLETLSSDIGIEVGTKIPLNGAIVEVFKKVRGNNGHSSVIIKLYPLIYTSVTTSTYYHYPVPYVIRSISHDTGIHSCKLIPPFEKVNQEAYFNRSRVYTVSFLSGGVLLGKDGSQIYADYKNSIPFWIYFRGAAEWGDINFYLFVPAPISSKETVINVNQLDEKGLKRIVGTIKLTFSTTANNTYLRYDPSVTITNP